MADDSHTVTWTENGDEGAVEFPSEAQARTFAKELFARPNLDDAPKVAKSKGGESK
jgi:hypothetical protein